MLTTNVSLLFEKKFYKLQNLKSCVHFIQIHSTDGHEIEVIWELEVAE